jgi:hypothetical protein
MSMQGIVTGNIADTPIKAKGVANMSPTEKAAFETPVQVDKVDVLEAVPAVDGAAWEIVVPAESFSNKRIGDSTNEFVRTTRRLKVDGGWIYCISTQGTGYVRNTCSVAATETSVFVPESKTKR